MISEYEIQSRILTQKKEKKTPVLACINKARENKNEIEAKRRVNQAVNNLNW